MAVTYGYLCEDAALELFIDGTLARLGPKLKCKAFEKSLKFEQMLKPTSGKNRKQIIEQYKDAAKSAISIQGLDLFIAGYDYDDANTDDYNLTLKNQIETLSVKSRNRTVMCVPVQCIEYWLWYIKYGDIEDKPASIPLEGNNEFNRHIAKSYVYECALDDKGKYPGRSTTYELEKAREILNRFDIDKLSSLSPSFKRFVSDIKSFCNMHA